jgi:hypothetical protein
MSTDSLMRFGRFDTHLRPFLYNFRPGGQGNMAKWALARAKMIANGYRPQVIFGGTSKMMDAGGGATDSAFGGTTFTVNAAIKAKTKFLCDLLNARGIPCSRHTTIGLQGMSTLPQLKAYDPRVSGLASWVTGNLGLGGRLLQSATPNVDALTFTPDAAAIVDTVESWAIYGPASGIYTVSDGATVVGTISTVQGAAGYLKATTALSTRAAAKVININRTAGNANPVHIGLVKAYDSQTPAIDIINAGWFGSKTADWIGAGSPWSPFNAIPLMAPDLFIHGTQANDMSTAGAVPVATWKANQKAILQQGMISGSAVLIFESLGLAPTFGDAPTQAAFRQAAYEIADELDIPLIDEDASFGTYALAQAAGKYADGIHENAIGNGELAQIYAALLGA